MLDLIANVLTGGATGLIGSVLSKAIGLFEARQKRKDRALEFEHELRLLDRQAAMAEVETESALAIAQAEAAAQARAASYAHDTGTGRPHRWVVSTLRLVRPVLTVTLIALVGVVFFATNDAGDRATIVASLIYMASSAVLWWFGDRAMTRDK